MAGVLGRFVKAAVSEVETSSLNEIDLRHAASLARHKVAQLCAPLCALEFLELLAQARVQSMRLDARLLAICSLCNS